MIDTAKLNTGFKLALEGNLEEANKIFDELIENNSTDIAFLGMLANLHIQTKQYEKAKDCLRKICNVKEDFKTITTLGDLEFQTENYDKAIAILEKALSIGKTPEIYRKLIASYRKLHIYGNALKRSKEMLELYPDNFEALNGLIDALINTGNVSDAKALCNEYIKKYPKAPLLWINLGFIEELSNSDYQKALEYYHKANEVDEDKTSSALYHIAIGYSNIGDYENSFKSYKHYIEKRPDNLSAKVSLGMLQLKFKQFEEGFNNYYQRPIIKHGLEGLSNNIYKFGKPFDNDIIVICDQGLGDHLQFIRYLPIIKNKFNSIQVATQKPLIRLFKNNFTDIEFIEPTEINPEKQAIRICDLPYVFGIDFDNIPYSSGYLNAEPAEIKSDKLKVGLCWEAGGIGIRGPLQRTIYIDYFDKIFKLDNIQTYSLQIEDTFNALQKYPQMINLGKNFKDFYDTAKAIKSMDLVICVDTSVMHLAAAMGVKTFLLLPYISDWRWFEDTKTTPWYDSVEIFKQTDPINWVEPIEDIICRLKELSS